MKNLVVAGVVLTIFLLSLIVSKRNKHFSDKFLIFYLFFATLRQVFYYLETMSFFQQSHLMLLGKGMYLLNAPLFFAYVYTFLTAKKISVRLWGVWLSPFIAYVIHFLYYDLWVFDRSMISIRSGLLLVDGQVSTSWLIFSICFLLIEPIYLAWYFVLLQKYRKGLLKFESSIDYHQLKWLYLLLYLWLLITVVLVPLSLFSVGINWLSHDFIQRMIQATSIVFFFVLGFYGFRQTSVFSDLNAAKAEKGKNASYQRSGLSGDQAKTYHKKLLTFMEEEKPYLNGELKATDLARQMGISVNHLSQVLSQIQKQNFFDFINEYRVKEVISKMKDPNLQHLTLLALALDAGFNSKTSFNSVFKKFTHQTPSAFYRAVKNKRKENA